MSKLFVLLSLFSSVAFAQQMSHEQIIKEFERKDVREAVFKPSSDYAENMSRLIAPEKFKPATEALGTYNLDNVDTPASVSWISRDTPIKNQENGHCTAYSLAGIMENIINKDGKKAGLDLSDEHLFNLYNVYQMDAAVKAVSAQKICDEVDYTQKGKITQRCRDAAHARVLSYQQISQGQVEQALSEGNPVYFGLGVPRGMANCEKVISDEVVTNGGHAVSLVAYNSTSPVKYYTIKNSWGSRCGDGGYQHIRADYCQKTWCYFYQINTVTSKYSAPAPTPLPTAKPLECESWKRVWYAPWRKVCRKWTT